MAEKISTIIANLMRNGLVFGKFMPLHTGHLELIQFAGERCDYLYIVVCVSNRENIPGSVRKFWLEGSLSKIENRSVIIFNYDESQLPNTSVSSKEVSADWAKAFMELLPAVDVVFTSELYGDYLAEFMGITHIVFDVQRNQSPVAASQIREKPFAFWDFIPPIVKPYFVKKVIILGTESTGKSCLAEKLAEHFETTFVPEMARAIVVHTETCEYHHLQQIAELHAKEINSRVKEANRILFIDTDVNITKSYSRFLFNRELEVSEFVSESNKGDLYLFLEPDCAYVQDGTRLSKDERARLNVSHKHLLDESGIQYHSISGKDWNDRLSKAVQIVKQKYFT